MHGDFALRSTIAILEDDARRIEMMLAILLAKLPDNEAQFFNASADIRRFLEQHWAGIAVVSLDHDLELVTGEDGQLIDPGTGREVADFLAERPPTFSVVIHSSNHFAAIGMNSVLQDSKWPTIRVAPYDDLAWIAEAWWPAMNEAIGSR